MPAVKSSKHTASADTLPVLGRWPVPAKVLATAIVLMMAVGMSGALGQIIVHDIIPTFSRAGHSVPGEEAQRQPTPAPETGRGDLFSDVTATETAPPNPFYLTDEFIFALKFTHIHVFGMSGIFIVMGALAVFLNRSTALRCWLVALPFAGILIDLASVWLKIFVHPAFFWLHIPGGLMFGIVFAVESILILKALWIENAEPPAGV